MRNRRRGHVLAIAVAGAIGWGGSISWAQQQPSQEPTAAELKAQIEALQKQVQRLEESQRDSARLAAQTETTKSEVMQDASKRSTLLGESEFTAGYQKGKFLIQSGDGNYLLHPWFQFQPRYVFNMRDDGKGPGDDDTESGFEIRRMKVGVDGNVFNKETTYNFTWATNRSGGALELEEAWVRHIFQNQVTLRGGQIKEPYSHENVASSKMLLAADRSLLNEVFVGGDNFIQGVAVGYGNDKNPWQMEVAYHDGPQSANTNFQDDVAPTNDTRPDWAFSGRAQYRAKGDWKQYADYTALNNKADLLVFGGGLNFNQTGDTNVFGQTVDAQWENTTGFGIYGEVHGRATDGSAGSLFDWGLMVQAAQMLDKKHWEVFGRYSFIDLDEDSVAAGFDNQLHEITIGLNYYFDGQNAKFTIDGTYLPNGVPTNITGIGFLANEDAEFVFRGQFQLLL
jgi:hypothetical protein